jgi:hypothetical protein
VYEDDRDESGTVGRGGNERGSFPHQPAEPAKEPERLQLDDRHAGECERQGRRWLVLEGNLLAGDRDQLPVPGEIEISRTESSAVALNGARWYAAFSWTPTDGTTLRASRTR